MSSKTVTVRFQWPVGFILFLVFLVLKLTEVIDWSWWWVTAPVWIPAGIGVLALVAVAVIGGIANLVESEQDKKIRETRERLRRR